MSIELRIILLVGLLALVVAVGAIWKAKTGTAKKIQDGEYVDLKELGAVKNGQPVTDLTTKVTFLQFSTDFCTFCGPTAKMLQALEVADPNVTHLEVNVTDRLDLVNKYNIMQTPTTLVLDRKGRIQSRIGGTPKAHTLVTEIGNFDI
ncbi:MAG: hypothetical protein RIR34_256 [Actinomycetota bacterium]|jgi:thiol-disulfide isomerase/thioredoxin